MATVCVTWQMLHIQHALPEVHIGSSRQARLRFGNAFLAVLGKRSPCRARKALTIPRFASALHVMLGKCSQCCASSSCKRLKTTCHRFFSSSFSERCALRGEWLRCEVFTPEFYTRERGYGSMSVRGSVRPVCRQRSSWLVFKSDANSTRVDVQLWSAR